MCLKLYFHKMTSWPSWLRRATVNRKIVSSTLTEVVIFLFMPHLKRLFYFIYFLALL